MTAREYAETDRNANSDGRNRLKLEVATAAKTKMPPFIITLATDIRQQAIVEGIISLAKALGMTVVAEGVEEQEQWTLLSRMGCDLVQGYICSRPLPPEEFAELLAVKYCPTVQAFLTDVG